MSQSPDATPTARPYYSPPSASSRPQPANLADILERVLDKGIIIAGDIRVNLLDIELLTIKIRLLIVSVDKAKEKQNELNKAMAADEARKANADMALLRQGLVTTAAGYQLAGESAADFRAALPLITSLAPERREEWSERPDDLLLLEEA